MISKRWKRFRNEQAQAMVEFALVLPIFLGIVLFILDAGWIAVQRTAFENGFMHATWTVSAEQIGDTGSHFEDEEETVYTIGVGDALKANIKEGNIWGLFSDNLSVSEASATCYNEAKQDLYVPSTDGKELNATSITRYMRLKAKISYDIYPLTFVGGTLFFPKGEGLQKITLVKEYDATRVLKSESRTG